MLQTFKTTLSSKKLLTGNIYLFNFKLIEPLEMKFIAGQYMMLKVPKDGSFVSRLYSIASPPNIKDSFELIIELVPQGIGSCYVESLKLGQEVVFQGPAGIFYLNQNEKTKIFLVTGTGIAPVRSILKGMTSANYYLFWGLKTLKDIYLLDEFKQFNLKICLSKENNLEMVTEVDRKYFDLGHVDYVFDKQFGNLTIEQLNNFEFYLCGARTVVESLKQFVLAKNIPPTNIHFEKF